jgi:hypothetical protein
MNINIQPLSTFFGLPPKNCIIKSCSPFEDVKAYKTSWHRVDKCKYCTHLGSLNVCHFGAAGAAGLKSKVSMSPLMT